MRRIATVSVYLSFIPICAGIGIALIGSPDLEKFGPYWPIGLVVAVLGLVVPLLLTWQGAHGRSAGLRKRGELQFQCHEQGMV